MTHWITLTTWNQAPNDPGCYVFYDEFGLFYIGSTTSLSQRLRNHHLERRTITKIKIRVTKRRGDFLMWEYRLLSRLKPHGNIKIPGRGVLINKTHVPLKRLMERVNPQQGITPFRRF